MATDRYTIDILVTGYPGKSVCHGGLGWSSIVLLRGYGRVVLVDVGSFGVRGILIEALASHGLKPSDVTDVLLTHSHYDHSVNWTLFPRARITIGADEMAWALQQPWGETPVPELYVKELSSLPRLATVRAGDEVIPDVVAIAAPGHTPGHLIYRLRGEERDVILVGDAAKNRAELLSRDTDMTLDAGQSARSIEGIWALWRERPGNILIPGHDLPMTQEDGAISYVGEREASIRAWFGEDMETTTFIELIQ